MLNDDPEWWRERLRKAVEAGRPDGLAFGRSIGDFLVDGTLPDPELHLIIQAAHGKRASLNDNRPTAEAPDQRIRAGLLRFLGLGGDATVPTHERGIELYGAWIASVLDFESAQNVRPLKLIGCHFQSAPMLRDAEMALVNFDSSSLPGLNGERLFVRRGVYLRKINSSAEICLIGAKIGADLSCNKASLTAGKTGIALNVDRLATHGSVFLRELISEGEIILTGAVIGSNLSIGAASLNAGKTGRSLTADSATVNGSVFLRGNWFANGRMDFVSATIKSNLHFSQRKPATKGPDLECDLRGARIGCLFDDATSWGDTRYQLDGLCYERLETPGSLEHRRAWLAGATEADASDFRPQPWEQLSRVLRAAGHEEDAREIDRDRRRRLRRQRRPSWSRLIAKMSDSTKAVSAAGSARLFSLPGMLIGATAGAVWWALTWAFMSVLAGEGYARRRLIALLLFFWLLGWGVYFEAAEQGWIAPAQPIMLVAETDGPAGDRVSLASLCAPDWRNCPHLPDGYPAFTSWVYSFDVILPVIGIGQEKHWAPVYLTLDDARTGPPPMEIFHVSLENLTGPILRAVFWGQTILGYALGAIIAAFISGVMRRD